MDKEYSTEFTTEFSLTFCFSHLLLRQLQLFQHNLASDISALLVLRILRSSNLDRITNRIGRTLSTVTALPSPYAGERSLNYLVITILNLSLLRGIDGPTGSNGNKKLDESTVFMISL